MCRNCYFWGFIVIGKLSQIYWAICIIWESTFVIIESIEVNGNHDRQWCYMLGCNSRFYLPHKVINVLIRNYLGVFFTRKTRLYLSNFDVWLNLNQCLFNTFEKNHVCVVCTNYKCTFSKCQIWKKITLAELSQLHYFMQKMAEKLV